MRVGPSEEAVVFDCDGTQIIGVLHVAQAQIARKIAIVVPVGGPQYRIGSHRQFVTIARRLADAGYPVFRFDYRGMGDSEGALRAFTEVEPDIHAALGIVKQKLPDRAIVLMGLCDAASAILLLSQRPESLRGIVLINPWVRTEQTLARTYARHYYGARLFSRDLWVQILRLQWDYRASLSDAMSNLKKLVKRPGVEVEKTTYIDQMRAGLNNLALPVLITLSERDLTAREFADLTSTDVKWRALVARDNVAVEHLAGADHTLSTTASLNAFVALMLDWLGSLPAPDSTCR